MSALILLYSRVGSPSSFNLSGYDKFLTEGSILVALRWTLSIFCILDLLCVDQTGDAYSICDLIFAL